MKSIKKRLVGSYLVVIFITVTILESFLLIAVRQYYLVNVEEILRKQAEVSANFYSEYLVGNSVEENARDLLDSFSTISTAQVQIFDAQGNKIEDTAGETQEKIISPDVNIALSGEIAKWQGKIQATQESVLSVAFPLKSGDTTVGAVRFITSLSDINNTIKTIALILIFVGILVIFIATLLSLFLSKTITEPVKEITDTAEKIAQGDLTARARKIYDDELGELADTLNFMSEEIIKHQKIKNDFIASISHELRTPLTSIKGWAITLKAGNLNDAKEIKDGLDIIEKENDRLTSLVEELLDFSKFESGEITLNFEKVDLKQLITYIVKQVSPRAKRNNIKISISFETEINKIKADENRLKQVFLNIIDNSLKFTTDGEITITLKQLQNTVLVKIIDTGIGIKKEDLPNVTQKFYKGNHRVSGSGLGLAISQEIINMHHGSLVIQSEENKGTSIEIKLPS